MQHAPEYWMLAHIIIGQSDSSQDDETPFPWLGGTRLSQFDEADMTQVNVLIKESHHSSIATV